MAKGISISTTDLVGNICAKQGCFVSLDSTGNEHEGLQQPNLKSSFDQTNLYAAGRYGDSTAGLLGRSTSKGQQCCCHDSSGNEHNDSHIFTIAAPMDKQIYRSIFKDIIHVSIEGLADWTFGSLRKRAPK